MGAALSHVRISDAVGMRPEEEKIRAALVDAGKEQATGSAPIVKSVGHGRNDLVTLRKGDHTQVLKFKKAESLLSQGWEIVGDA